MQLLKRIAFEAWLPIISAVLWGIYSYKQPGSVRFNVAKDAGQAFFLVFFFQGQFLRIKKNIRDDERGERTFDTVSSVERAVQEMSRLLAARAGALIHSLVSGIRIPDFR